MVKGDRDIPVSQHLVPPSGCPKSLKSTEDCNAPTDSPVCLKFCPKGLLETYHEKLDRMPTPRTTEDAFALLLTVTVAAVEEGKMTTENALKLWEDIGKDLKDDSKTK